MCPLPCPAVACVAAPGPCYLMKQSLLVGLRVLFRGQNYAAFVQYMFAMRYKNIKKSFISCPLCPALQPRQSCPSVLCAGANPAEL